MKKHTFLLALLLSACPKDSETDDDVGGTETDGPLPTCSPLGVFAADELGRRWYTEDSWPAWAHALDENDLQDGLDSGTLVPVDLGLDGKCYKLEGADHHPCVVPTGECTDLFGRPRREMILQLSNCAPVGGPWSEVVEAVDDPYQQCWGIIGDFAVLLRTDEPACAHAGSLGCPCDPEGCETNLVCQGGLCGSCPVGNIGCACGDGQCDDGLICVSGVCFSA